MKQIPIAFDKQTEEKLRNNAKIKELKLAQYIRQLVDIGLRVEEIAEKKESEGNKEEHTEMEKLLETQQTLIQKGLISTYEILYLIRYILTTLPEHELDAHNKIFDQSQIKAKQLVENLFKYNLK